MPGKCIPDEKIEEIRNFAALGFSYKDIAKQLNITPDTVTKYAGRKHEHKGALPKETVDRMVGMESVGLSHQQIAKELGLATKTVYRYLGKQRSGVRAQYGSIVAHVTGESFVSKELAQRIESRKPEIKEDKKMTSNLKITSTSIHVEGKDFHYRVSTDGKVRITSDTGFAVDLEKDGFLNLICELSQLVDWLAKNSSEGRELKIV